MLSLRWGFFNIGSLNFVEIVVGIVCGVVLCIKILVCVCVILEVCIE